VLTANAEGLHFESIPALEDPDVPVGIGGDLDCLGHCFGPHLFRLVFAVSMAFCNRNSHMPSIEK
jgi:hypothetical protein